VLFDMSDLASCAICLSEAMSGEALEAAYGVQPPAVPATVPSTARSCQKALDKDAATLAKGWSGALARCEDRNASGRTVPAVDCTTDPEGRIAAAKTKAAQQLGRCSSFTGLAGCATSGSAAAVQACFEAAIGAVVGPYTEGAYP
jgi:hypothetical protein